MSLGCDEAGGGYPCGKPLGCKGLRCEVGNFCGACSVVAGRANEEKCIALTAPRGHTVGCNHSRNRATNKFYPCLFRTVGRAR